MENEETSDRPSAETGQDPHGDPAKNSQTETGSPDSHANSHAAEERIFQAEVVDEDVVDVEVIKDAALAGRPLQGPNQAVAPVVNKGSPFAANANPHFPGTVKPHAVNPVWMPEYERYSARAGAVGALFLGVISILGGLLTPMALVNAFFGFLFGLWGLSSERKRTAIVGMVLCGVGFCLTIVRFAIGATIKS